MIYEYAFDPAAIAELADKASLQALVRNCFGWGKPCVAAGYPENLVTLTLDAVNKDIASAHGERKAKLQQKKARVEVIAKQVSECRTRREGAAPWSESGIETLLAEHKRLAFAEIFSSSTSPEKSVRSLQKLGEKDCPVCARNTSQVVRRTPRDLANALNPFLQSASEVTFVDPYFFNDRRFLLPYAEYFSLIAATQPVRTRTPILIRIVTNRNPNASPRSGRSVPQDEFTRSCDEILQGKILPQIQLEIFRISEQQGQQELHNRHVITNIGGVTLGHGTDCSISSGQDSFDDIAIMGGEQYRIRKSMYTPGSKHFQWPAQPDWKSTP